MTKDEKRAMARTNRERMMSGDEKYVLPRDRGKVRAYVRDLVDTRRNVAGILLPIALLSFVILLIPIPLVQAYGPLVLLVAIVAAILDSVIFGRQLSKKVQAEVPQRRRLRPVDQGLLARLLRLQPGLPDPPLAGAAAAGRRRAPRSTDAMRR